MPGSWLGSALMVARFLVDAAQLPGDPLAVDGCQLGTVEAAGAVAYSCNKHGPQAGGIMSIFLPLSARARLSLYVWPYIYFIYI